MIQYHPARKAILVAGLASLLAVAPGCLFSPDSGGGPGPCGEDCREPERTSVQGAIQLYRFIWQQRRLDLYEQLLHPAYVYVPQEEDVDDFVWLNGEDWSRDDELLMAGNMFNPEFVSNVTNESVDSIKMELDSQNERPVVEGVEVTTIADIQVLWAEGTGATSNVKFTFTVVEDPDEPGMFQIFRQVELPPFGG